LTTAGSSQRQLSIQDRQDIFAFYSGPDINQYPDRPPGKTIEVAITFINISTVAIKKNNFVYWITPLA
jgi:hypothetical protein